MKKIAFLFFLSFASYGEFPVLEVKKGALDSESNIKRIETCIIYSDHKDIDADEVLKMTARASSFKVKPSLYIRRQVPSFEVTAYTTELNADDRKAGLKYKGFLLKEEAQGLKLRAGTDAIKLIKIAEDICDIDRERN